MNDEAAFVAAIAAAPDDTHLPLVFADWLDDHGDPRGQWVRNGYVHPWMPPTYESPVPKLLRSLAGDKRVIDVRRAAQVIGAPIVPGLVELLKHEKSRVRQQACMCLRSIGKRAAEAVPALLAALGDPDGNVRTQAAKALKDIDPAGVTDTGPLKAALTDDDWNVRQAASKVLGSMRAKGSVLRELTEKFDSPDAGDRLNVVEGLAQLGTADAIPVLDRAIDDPSAAVRGRAVEALGRLKFAAVVSLLCRATRDPLAKVRITAARQFGRYSSDQPVTAEVVTALVRLLDDAVPEVRAAACRSLAAGAPELVRPFVPRVVALLGDLSADVQEYAMETLARIAVGDRAALVALIEELKSLAPQHRREAAVAVAAVGKGDSAALAALVPLLNDPDDQVATVATRVVAENWDELPGAVAPALLARLAGLRVTDQDVHEIAGVLTALGRFKTPSAAALGALRGAVRNPLQGYGATPAVEALGEIGPAAAEAAPDLLALFTDGVPTIYYRSYQAAVRALVRMGDPGIAGLSALLDCEHELACRHVLESAVNLGPHGEVLLPVLLRLARRTTNDGRRDGALAAIRQLGPTADALPDLLKMLDELPRSRLNVLRVIQDLGPAALPHVPKVMELARQAESEEHRGTFAEFFQRLAPAEEVREPLRELLRIAVPQEDSSGGLRPWGRRRARELCGLGLLKFKDPSLVSDLAPLVTDPEVELRREFVPRIAMLNSPLTVPLMRRALSDLDDAVRLGALVLDFHGDSSEETVAALVLALEDRFPKVRRAAADALGKLDVATAAVLTALQAATGDGDKQTAARAGVALRKLAPKAKAEPKNVRAPAKGKKKRG